MPQQADPDAITATARSEPLADALRGLFERPFAQLTRELQLVVAKRFLVDWDMLTPARRRDAALRWDIEHHPSLAHENDALWKKCLEVADCETTASSLPLKRRTMADVELQATRLRELRAQVVSLERALLRKAESLGLGRFDGKREGALRRLGYQLSLLRDAMRAAATKWRERRTTGSDVDSRESMGAVGSVVRGGGSRDAAESPLADVKSPAVTAEAPAATAAKWQAAAETWTQAANDAWQQHYSNNKSGAAVPDSGGDRSTSVTGSDVVASVPEARAKLPRQIRHRSLVGVRWKRQEGERPALQTPASEPVISAATLPLTLSENASGEPAADLAAASGIGPPLPAAEMRSGAQGRPTSMHLVAIELGRRRLARTTLPTQTLEANELAAWLAREHPRMPPARAKAIINSLRKALKAAVLEQHPK